jgi:hypothetical protein
MHSVNFTALSRAVRFLSPPVAVLLAVSVLLAVPPVVPAGPAVLVPLLLRVPPQPALEAIAAMTTSRPPATRILRIGIRLVVGRAGLL